MNSHVAALLIEREGYIRRGRSDRVAMVDEVLRTLGCEIGNIETTSVSPNQETTTRKKPSRRKKG